MSIRSVPHGGADAGEEFSGEFHLVAFGILFGLDAARIAPHGHFVRGRGYHLAACALISALLGLREELEQAGGGEGVGLCECVAYGDGWLGKGTVGHGYGFRLLCIGVEGEDGLVEVLLHGLVILFVCMINDAKLDRLRREKLLITPFGKLEMIYGKWEMCNFAV